MIKKNMILRYKKPGIFSCHVWWDLRDPKCNHQFVQPSPFFPHHRHYGDAKLSMAHSGGNTAADKGRLSGGLEYEPYIYWNILWCFFRDILWTICKGYLYWFIYCHFYGINVVLSHQISQPLFGDNTLFFQMPEDSASKWRTRSSNMASG